MSKRRVEESFDLNDLEALGLSQFDPVEHLTSKAAIAAYMNEAVAAGDADLFLVAMNDVVRAYGMSKVAERAAITREGAYKALRSGSKPRFETIVNMLDALDMRFVIVPKDAALAKAGAAIESV